LRRLHAPVPHAAIEHRIRIAAVAAANGHRTRTVTTAAETQARLITIGSVVRENTGHCAIIVGALVHDAHNGSQGCANAHATRNVYTETHGFTQCAQPARRPRRRMNRRSTEPGKHGAETRHAEENASGCTLTSHKKTAPAVAAFSDTCPCEHGRRATASTVAAFFSPIHARQLAQRPRYRTESRERPRIRWPQQHTERRGAQRTARRTPRHGGQMPRRCDTQTQKTSTTWYINDDITYNTMS
jgi:hypothetical protein